MGSWGVTPRESIEAECARVGTARVVSGCLGLLAGASSPSPGLEEVLAGPAAHSHGGYWPRVWALRGLLYAWEPRAAPAVVSALSDEAWRVREMACRVIGRHTVDEGLEALEPLVRDPVARVRAAALRARRRLTEAPGRPAG